jgi:hypothetical protein
MILVHVVAICCQDRGLHGRTLAVSRQSAREQSLWRNYMPFSQMMPLRRDSSGISDHRATAKAHLSDCASHPPCHAQPFALSSGGSSNFHK